jgi:hypothetical protein
MKTSKGLFGWMMVAAVTLFSAQSCSKDDATGDISGTDITLAQDDAYADALYDEVDNFVVTELVTLDAGGYSTAMLKSAVEETCYTVTVDHPDLTTFPKVITIDFGAGCSVVFNGDTITREGQIIITITNRWYITGAEHSITFNNFYINGVRLEGTRTLTNLGMNIRNHFELRVVLEAGKVTFNDTAWVTRDAEHVREWSRQLNPMNDTLWITGSASGVNILGENYSRVIVEPLILIRCADAQYRWVIADGVVEITNSVRGSSTIDYSNSGCSGDVIIGKNGNEFQYHFRYRYHHHRNQN